MTPRPKSASYLIAVDGPAIQPITLHAGTAPSKAVVLGRHQDCELRLPPGAEQASRFHCSFRFENGQWRLTDLASRRGTFVNGIRLTPKHEVVLADGDLIRVEPWTFALSGNLTRAGTRSEDDRGMSTIHTMIPASPAAGQLDGQLLGLLLEASGAIHSAETEIQLAEHLITAAVRGTGLTNAAVLRPLDAAGQVEVIASKTASSTAGGFRFSRSLIAAASTGQLAEVSTDSMPAENVSLIAMNVTAALCVPLMVGPIACFFLYLDARSEHSRAPRSLRPNATAFTAALGHLASLALSNMKRAEMERRQQWLDKELRDARAAQSWILPRRRTDIGPYTCVGESRPGQFLGGDFFEVIDLGDGKIAVALGDVSGKGIVASVLMTAALGYLHAAIRHFGEPGVAVTALNRYIAPRRPEDKFVTLWVGILDPVAGELRYVDAGHGYAILIDHLQQVTTLDVNGGPLLGIDDQFVYESVTVKLPASGSVLVVSDGIVEQPGPGVGESNAPRNPFNMTGVCQSLGVHPDQVSVLFEAVITHAGGDQLADDATAVSVQWSERTAIPG